MLNNLAIQKLTSKMLLYCFLTIVSIATSYSAFTKEEDTGNKSFSNENDVWIGPGVIFACKYIQLYQIHVIGKGEKEISIDYKSENFSKTRSWVFKQFYDILNPPRKISTKRAKYCLALSTLQNGNMKDILLIIPLTEETLGPNPDAKIEELRKLMTQTK